MGFCCVVSGQASTSNQEAEWNRAISCKKGKNKRGGGMSVCKRRAKSVGNSGSHGNLTRKETNV